LIGAKNAYGLLLDGDAFLTACVGQESGDTPYRVHWLRTMPVEGITASEPWRELQKQLKQTMLVVPSENATLVQASLPPLKSEEIRVGLLGLVLKLKGGEPEAWQLAHDRREGGEAGRNVHTGLGLELANLAPYLAPFEVTGARPRQALPGALILDQFLRGQLDGEEEGGAWNLVYVGKEEQQLVIGDAQGPRLMRSLPHDLSQGAEPEEYVERLSTEVERSNFFAQQGEASTRVQRILVCGDPALAEPLVAKLAQTDGLVAEWWRPEQLFAVDEGCASWDVLMPLVAAVVGMGSAGLNIMPVSDDQNPGRRFRRQALGVIAVACLVLLPLLGGGGHSTRRVQRRTMDSQFSQIGEARVLAEEAARNYLRDQSLLARQARIESKDPHRVDLGGLLRDLSSRIPGEAHLTTIELKQDYRGGYHLELHGECIGETAEKAQAEFLRLHRDMGASPTLDAEAEPTQLQIIGGKSGGATVTFTLRYALLEEVGG
jgi:hypothetical protein